MAKKKNKRPNLSQETLERARAEMRGERPEPAMALESPGQNAIKAVPASAKAKRSGPSPLATRRIPTLDELLTEYTYVLKDLRYLAILAFILMAAIVIAALTLPRATG
jgi:hypothetical protein